LQSAILTADILKGGAEKMVSQKLKFLKLGFSAVFDGALPYCASCLSMLR
jgi:hypothetical protein